MTREIKFRGKRVDGLGWAFGDLLTDYIHHEGWTIVHGGCVYFEVDPETVGQYTGLKDENGTDIYEGDILRVTDDADEIHKWDRYTGIGEVVWLNKRLLWYVSNVSNGLGDLNDVSHLEVIGNKFHPMAICWRGRGKNNDNPEYLEVE